MDAGAKVLNFPNSKDITAPQKQATRTQTTREDEKQSTNKPNTSVAEIYSKTYSASTFALLAHIAFDAQRSFRPDGSIVALKPSMAHGKFNQLLY